MTALHTPATGAVARPSASAATTTSPFVIGRPATSNGPWRARFEHTARAHQREPTKAQQHAPLHTPALGEPEPEARRDSQRRRAASLTQRPAALRAARVLRRARGSSAQARPAGAVAQRPVAHTTARRASRRRQQRPSARRPAAPRGTRCCVERPGGRHALLRAMGAGARSGRAPARTAREKLRAMEAMLTPACPRESPEGAARGPERLGPFTASTAVAPSVSAAERALSPESQRRCGARGRLCALRGTETSGGALPLAQVSRNSSGNKTPRSKTRFRKFPWK